MCNQQVDGLGEWLLPSCLVQAAVLGAGGKQLAAWFLQHEKEASGVYERFLESPTSLTKASPCSLVQLGYADAHHCCLFTHAPVVHSGFGFQ